MRRDRRSEATTRGCTIFGRHTLQTGRQPSIVSSAGPYDSPAVIHLCSPIPLASSVRNGSRAERSRLRCLIPAQKRRRVLRSRMMTTHSVSSRRQVRRDRDGGSLRPGQRCHRRPFGSASQLMTRAHGFHVGHVSTVPSVHALRTVNRATTRSPFARLQNPVALDIRQTPLGSVSMWLMMGPSAHLDAHRPTLAPTDTGWVIDGIFHMSTLNRVLIRRPSRWETECE